MSAVAVLVVPACDRGSTASIRYRLIGLPTAVGGACPNPPIAQAPVVAGATSVRLTFRDPGGPLRCDVALPIDHGAGAAPVIDVPDRSKPVDLFAEYFDDRGVMLARGAAFGVDLAAGGDVEIMIAPARAFSCTSGPMARPRAFHSATLLPTGEVLILGGLGASDGSDDPRAPIDPAAGLYVTASAELYRPASRTFVPITIPGLTPRAFHDAYVSQEASGAIHVAIVGGLGASGDARTSVVATGGGKYHWSPTAMARPVAGERIDYDPVAGTFSRAALPAGTDVPARILGALPASEASAPPVPFVGGVDGGGAALTSFDLFGGATPATGALRRPRVGATATVVDASHVLVWGGDTGTPPPTLEAGELLGGLPGAPSTQALTVTAGGGVRAFHAAARAGGGAIVIAGGFAMSAGAAGAPPAQAGVAVTIAIGPGAPTATGVDVGGPPGGYPAAITLGDGDVLITGGDPAMGTAGCTDASGLSCALAEVWRYPAAGGAGAMALPMQLARYGHRMTTLADGTVLVTGGFGPAREAGKVGAVGDAELTEWRSADDDPIADLAPAVTRAPGDVVRSGGAPASPCAIVAHQP